MRVLMLGWDFSPRMSGGVGSACQGLAEAMARSGTEVLFVLPRLRGDEGAEKVRLASTADVVPAPLSSAVPRNDPPQAEGRTVAVRGEETPARAPAPQDPPPGAASGTRPPWLPRIAEALHLFTIDSPLRPYLSAREYDSVVRELHARINPATQQPPPFREAKPSERRRSKSASAAPGPAAGARTPALPYGLTLTAEVERFARATLTVALRESFGVIHAHDWMTFPAGLLLREATGKPLAVHFHSSEVERRGSNASSEVREVEQAALTAADRVLCVSESSARSLRIHYSVERAKMRVLHDAYSPLPETERPPKDAPIVLYLGRLSEQKSPDVFLRGCARVAKRHPEARFVLAGEGELYPELKALAEELDLLDRVRFTGFVTGEELARTYAIADVYVLSSAAEPFGISALESLSLGVPTIVPRGAGVTEVVSSVLRFRPGDVVDLAEKIGAVLERPALRTQLVSAGLREVKNLRWDRPARALRGIYDEIVRS